MSPAAGRATTNASPSCSTASGYVPPGSPASWSSPPRTPASPRRPSRASSPHPLCGQLRLRPIRLHPGHPPRRLRPRAAGPCRRTARDRWVAGPLGQTGRCLGHQPHRTWRLQHRPDRRSPLPGRYRNPGGGHRPGSTWCPAPFLKTRIQPPHPSADTSTIRLPGLLTAPVSRPCHCGTSTLACSTSPFRRDPPDWAGTANAVTSVSVGHRPIRGPGST
jgi:hypothetical protein